MDIVKGKIADAEIELKALKSKVIQLESVPERNEQQNLDLHDLRRELHDLRQEKNGLQEEKNLLLKQTSGITKRYRLLWLISFLHESSLIDWQLAIVFTDDYSWTRLLLFFMCFAPERETRLANIAIANEEKTKGSSFFVFTEFLELVLYNEPVSAIDKTMLHA